MELAPELRPYDPENESRGDFVRRLVQHYREASDLSVMDAAVRRIAGADRFASIRVFVSCSKCDISRASEISRVLKSFGYDVWLEEWRVGSGESLSLKVQEGMQNADLMLLFLTKAAAESPNAIFELGMWMGSRGSSGLIPVLLEDCDVPEVLHGLRTLSLVDEQDSHVAARAVQQEILATVSRIALPGALMAEPRVFRQTAQGAAVFLALRMNSPESMGFRQALGEALGYRLGLKVTDGKVPSGTRWADAIRFRIRQSRAVIADVTGMRSNVLFEIGFAYGLQKPVIPVVAAPEVRGTLPHWLLATQIGDYATHSGILGIVSNVAAHLSDPKLSRMPRTAVPVPGLAVWFRVFDWNNDAREKFQEAAGRGGLRAETLEESSDYELIIRRATSASLLVISFDGTTSDALCHYICGAIVARPNAGYGARLLARRILLLTPPGAGHRELIADSLKRCQDTAEVVELARVGPETQNFGERYGRWLE